MANNMNKYKLWSDSKTKNALTTYAEGLACDNFDNRKIYNVWRNDANSWWVLKKTAGTIAMVSYESSKILYDRVRIVNIDCDGFMSCSCGKVQMYMMPCRHICAIIDKKEFYVPSMFHIRWHKMFNYYHGNNFGSKLATNSTHSINKIVTLTRNKCFRESGSYKGVYINDTAFFKQLPNFDSMKTNDNILVPNLMTKILTQTKRGVPVIKDSIQLDVTETLMEINDFDDANFIAVDLHSDVMTNMGGSSQVQCHLSQQNEDNDNDIETNNIQRNTHYKDALPLFEEMVNSCPNKHLFNEMCQFMRDRHMIHISSRGYNNQVTNANGIVLFGENNTNKRSMKRHKFMHEK